MPCRATANSLILLKVQNISACVHCCERGVRYFEIKLSGKFIWLFNIKRLPNIITLIPKSLILSPRSLAKTTSIHPLHATSPTTLFLCQQTGTLPPLFLSISFFGLLWWPLESNDLGFKPFWSELKSCVDPTILICSPLSYCIFSLPIPCPSLFCVEIWSLLLLLLATLLLAQGQRMEPLLI